MSDEVDDFLEHHGVKGMKWGARRQRSLDRIERVANSTASTRDKLHALTQVPTLNIVKGKGLSGGAKITAEKRKARRDRIQSGQGTVKDLLVQLGTVRIADLGPLDR